MIKKALQTDIGMWAFMLAILLIAYKLEHVSWAVSALVVVLGVVISLVILYQPSNTEQTEQTEQRNKKE